MRDIISHIKQYRNRELIINCNKGHLPNNSKSIFWIKFLEIDIMLFCLLFWITYLNWLSPLQRALEILFKFKKILETWAWVKNLARILQKCCCTCVGYSENAPLLEYPTRNRWHFLTVRQHISEPFALSLGRTLASMHTRIVLGLWIFRRTYLFCQYF